MFETNLVTILTPCYNKGKVCGRFIQSVIDQTYRPIELIIVNDGSTDESEKVILSYSSKLKEAGIAFNYILQQNSGVGAALNTGLKEVHGEFLCWPDIDDWYAPEATSEKVKFLKEHLDFAAASTDADTYYENDMTTARGLQSDHFKEKNRDEHQFYHLLCGQSIVCPGCHMIRSEALCDSLGKMEIFPSRFGQNLQMLYPVYYHYKRGFIDKPLYHYVVYENSHSHYKPNFEKQMKEREGRYEIKMRTLESIQRMPSEEIDECKKIIDVQEAKYRLNVAFEHRKKDLAKVQIEKLKAYGAREFKHIIQYWGTTNYLVRKIYGIIW